MNWRWFWLILCPHLFEACLPESYFQKTAQRSTTFFVDSVGVTEAHKLEVTAMVLGAKLPMSELRTRVKIIPSPQQDVLLAVKGDDAIPIKIKKLGDAMYEITSRTALEGEQYYGIYAKNPASQKHELIHTFFLWPKRPRLIAHNLGAGEPKLVEAELRYFSFEFDKPVYLNHDDAISVVSLDGSGRVTIEDITVFGDRKEVKVAIKGLETNKFYAVIFHDGMMDRYGQPVAQPPINFLAIESKAGINELWPLSLRTSDHGVEFNWGLDQEHSAQVFIAEEESPLDCVVGLCPLTVKGSAVSGQDDEVFHRTQIFAQGLKANTLYRLLMINQDRNGFRIEAKGTFKTRASEGIRISEVMINPRRKAKETESVAEFIEIVNLSEEAQDLNELYLTVEDHETGKIKECKLSESGSIPALKPKGYALIVASGFQKSRYHLDKRVFVIELMQKTLCGGLANRRKKTVRLERGVGHLLDRFGGHKWYSQEGQSVQRIDLLGLDIDANYCLGDKQSGPTPGRENGPCE